MLFFLNVREMFLHILKMIWKKVKVPHFFARQKGICLKLYGENL